MYGLVIPLRWWSGCRAVVCPGEFVGQAGLGGGSFERTLPVAVSCCGRWWVAVKGGGRWVALGFGDALVDHHEGVALRESCRPVVELALRTEARCDLPSPKSQPLPDGSIL
jgi:hypothetical protein